MVFKLLYSGGEEVVKYIYGDLVLIENIIMNYIIFLCTAKFSKNGYKKLRLLLASFIGALYSFFYFLQGYEFLYTWLLKIIFSLFIIIIAFTPYRLTELVKITGIFYTVSFAFGGATFGLYYLVNGMQCSYKDMLYLKGFPSKLFLLSIIIAYITIKHVWNYIIYRTKRERVISRINISLNNKSILIPALVDTGNSLYDPISKLPVVIVEYSSVKNIIPNDMQKIFDDNKENNMSLIASLASKPEWLTKFRIIPFKSLGKENALMIGFKPDTFDIELNNQKQNTNDLIIGIYNKKFSSSGEYGALIHPDILGIFNGGNINV